MADYDKKAVLRNLDHISEFGRWDDLYALVDTPVESAVFDLISIQLILDMQCKTPSLLAKWLKSENASSVHSRQLAHKTREALHLSHKEYRQMLSKLRNKINIVETLMSQNRWDEIEFDKIPSKAGLIYRNAFARRDIIKEKYKQFAKDADTKVNAATLYPYECVNKAINLMCSGSWWYDDRTVSLDDTERLMINKYWENLPDVLNGVSSKILCVCDTSGSMCGTPINVAIGLSMYCAERLGGPFKNHYVSFSSRPQLIEVEGVDFCDKVSRIYKTNLVENTNLEATFDLIKKVALQSDPEDIPETICIISDMQIDRMSKEHWDADRAKTGMELIREDWERCGLKCPRLVYWNVDARQGTILDAGPNVSFVSGFSPVLFESIVKGKFGKDLMLDKLNSERYACIH